MEVRCQKTNATRRSDVKNIFSPNLHGGHEVIRNFAGATKCAVEVIKIVEDLNGCHKTCSGMLLKTATTHFLIISTYFHSMFVCEKEKTTFHLFTFSVFVRESL